MRRLLMSVVVVVLLLWAAGHAGNVLVIDAPERSDVIVVLAGETDRRPAKALQLFDHGYAPKIILDVPANEKVFEFSLIELARKYAEGLPEAASISLCPTRGLSTKEEAEDVQKCLSPSGEHRVLIVTSDFHTRRALDIFRHEVSGHTFSIAGAQDSIQFGTRWWTHRQWAKTFVDEWLRLLWWKGIDQWH